MPADAARGQAQDLDAGAHAEQLERADVRGVGVELVARGVADHDRDRRAPAAARAAARGAASRAPVGRERPGRRLGAVAGGRSRRASAAAPPRPSARPSAARAPPRSRRRRARARRRRARRRASCVSAASPSRARETADEIDSPSCSASRSAAISPCVNRRCLPGERCGFGKPNRRSHARSVLGLTFSNAAASLVFR